jgi:cysteinyl-tRNA synthetase
MKADQEIGELLAKRESFRQEKNFAESDKLRDELLAKGIMVNDTAKGYRIRLKEVV